MKIKNKYILFLLTSFLVLRMNNAIIAQDAQSPAILEYIQSYAPIAIEEMIRTGVPASIKIAQGILETNAGRGELVIRSNNHFGIKCKSSWTGEKVYHNDDEEGECFRKYETAVDSYADHSNYLKTQPRYSFLFNYDKNDYSSWAWGLKKAGYATNPIYAQTLIKYIERYNLNQLNKYEVLPNQAELNSLYSTIKETTPSSLLAVKFTKNEVEETEKRRQSNEVQPEKKALDRDSYPSGIFKVNGLKVIHVKKGTSALALAKKYKLQVSSLLHWNDLPNNTTMLKDDQLIFIQKKRKTGASQYHLIKENEDIRDISQKEGVQLSSLLKLNKLKPGMMPKPGEKISLKAQRKYMPQLVVETPVHIVKKGESLYTISKKYNVSIDSIKDANAIRNDDLQVGQKLKILK